MESEITYDDYLAHYGVKGMKWGVRKEDSYNTKDSRAANKKTKSAKAETALNFAKATPLAMAVPRTTPETLAIQFAMAKGLTYAQMPGMSAMFSMNPATVAIGAAVTAVDSGLYRIPTVAIKNARKNGFNRDESLSKKDMTINELKTKVAGGVNPDYPKLGTTNNCMRASYAYEMRRRGFDVKATKTMFATGQTSYYQKGASGFKDSNKKIRSELNQQSKLITFFTGDKPSGSDVHRALSNEPDRSRGEFQVTWKGGRAGHSMAYEIINNKPVIFDTQTGDTYSTPKQLDKIMNNVSRANYTRLDNKKLNPLMMIAWVQDREQK